MAVFLPIPLKKTWEADLIKPLKTFIEQTFSNIEYEEYGKSLSDFNKLRNSVISKQSDKHETSLEVLYRYYDQLEAIEGKFPINESQIRINFKWQDAFDKDSSSLFSGRRTLTIASASYEKACLLFNIAALQSQIASSQNTDNDDGLKTAAKFFQQAAGIMIHLKGIVMSCTNNDPTPDLQQDTINALSSVLIAQAQDCVCRKAILGKMKPAVVAVICRQASEYYGESMKLLQLTSIRDLWPKKWIASVAASQAAYHSLAEYFQSQLAKERKAFGEEIARLKHADELMTAASSRGGVYFAHEAWVSRIRNTFESASKDNSHIYHDKIPDINTLAAIDKKAFVKPAELTYPLSSNFTDLFEKLVPLAVHTALQSVDAQKSQIINQEVGRLREATQVLNSVNASLNLPAAIEDLTGSKVPVSLMEKAEKVRNLGGIDTLNQAMTDLPDLLTRNREILNESIRMLDDEEASDDQLRQQFKERWTRTSSQKLTQAIRSESAKYSGIIDNAISADHVVQERYQKNKEGFEILSKSNAEIESNLPSSGPVASLQNSPVVADLRQLMEDVDTLKAERDAIENDLKNSTCDLSSRFTNALAQDGVLDEVAIMSTELDNVFGPLREQVNDSLNRQEALISRIQNANDAFVAAKSSGSNGTSREEKMKELAVAYDQFVELLNNLKEGTKFYNDLTQLLVKFQGKCSDLCFARKTEKDDLMKDLQSSIANTPSRQAPSVPGYQNVTAPQSTPISNMPPANAPYGTQPYSAPPMNQPYGQYPAAPVNNYTPYPMYPPQGYAPPPMPVGYNPYNPYGMPQQYPQQPYNQFPSYPQQNYRSQ